MADLIYDEWRRRERSFIIIGRPDRGFHVRACGNNRILSDKDALFKSLEDARQWLNYYYPGVIPAEEYWRNKE